MKMSNSYPNNLRWRLYLLELECSDS